MDIRKYDGNLSSIDFLDMMMLDIYGNIRHVSIPKGYISEKLFKDGIGFDASNFGFAKVTDSDMVAVPDMTTAFSEEKDGYTILHVFCDVMLTSGEAYDQYPRNIARNTLKYLQENNIADNAKMLVELEFHVFDSVKYSSDVAHSYYMIESAEGLGGDRPDYPRFGAQKGYHKMTPEDRYEFLRNESVSKMEAIGIPVKYHHHEVSASQLEIELNFIDLLHAGDAVCLAKWIIKTIADELGVFVTFMPKPMYKLAGNGMHVHQFLEKNGASIFTGEEIYHLSKEGLGYTAGILEHSVSGSLLAFSNPSTNSYRRLVPGYEAPVSASFAKGSRCAAIRIPGYLKKGEVRTEFRTGDATCNVYFALSAMVLAGVDGIKKNMDPIALGYNCPDGKSEKVFPLNLNTVLDGLEKDNEYLRPAFPEKLIKAWVELKRKEAEYVYNAPTPQEYELYF